MAPGNPDSDPAPVTARLKHLRESAGLSVRAVAESIDMATSSYQHYEKGYKKDLIPVELAEKLAKVFATRGVDPAAILALAGLEANRIEGMGLRESDLVEYEARAAGNGSDGGDAALVAALAPDRAHASLWLVRNNALEGAGYLAGDLVVVDLEEEPRSGDVVCAQIYDWQAGTANTVLRIYEPPYLIAASREARFRRPDLIDNERVNVKGVVVAGIRRRA